MVAERVGVGQRTGRPGGPTSVTSIATGWTSMLPGFATSPTAESRRSRSARGRCSSARCT